MATLAPAAPKPRDPFAAILLPRHDRVRLLAHYEYAEPHVDPRDLRTWRYESVYQLATRGEMLARYLAKTGPHVVPQRRFPVSYSSSRVYSNNFRHVFPARHRPPRAGVTNVQRRST